MGLRLVALRYLETLAGDLQPTDPLQCEQAHAGTIMGIPEQINSPLVKDQGVGVDLVLLCRTLVLFGILQPDTVLLQQRFLQIFHKGCGRGVVARSVQERQ